MATGTLPQRVEALFTINGAGHRLGIPRYRIEREILLGHLKAIVAGERLLIAESSLLAYKAAHTPGD